MRLSMGLGALLLPGLLAVASPASAQLPAAEVQKILVTLPEGVEFRATGHQLKVVFSISGRKSSQALGLEIAKLATLPDGRAKATLRIAPSSTAAYKAILEMQEQPQTRIAAAPTLRLCSLATGIGSGVANWTIQTRGGTSSSFKTSISAIPGDLPRCDESNRARP